MRVRDYYAVLGVLRSESQGGIREAFRHLAARYHPDRAGAGNTLLFQEIVEAYRVLAHPERRALYDRILKHLAPGPARPGPIVVEGPVAPEASALRAPALEEALAPRPVPPLRGRVVRPDLAVLAEEMLRRTLGDHPPGEGPRALPVELELSPLQAAQGGAIRFGLPVLYPCPSCHGSGKGTEEDCMGCAGTGLIEEEETVAAHIPPNVRDGDELDLPLRGLGIQNHYLRIRIHVG